MKGLLSLYSWAYPAAIVYMLQTAEYRAGPYIAWYWRVADFRQVMQRRQLVRTTPATLLLALLCLGMTLQVVAGLGLLAGWWLYGWPLWAAGLALIVSYPVVWAHLVAVPLWLGRLLVVAPRQAAALRRAERIFAGHPAIKLAVVGSYGKTTMKELLLTVLGAARKVAATPGNKNVAESHARFAAGLTGDEDILIIEYGEGRPGDVAAFARRTHPTHAVVTGLAPAHLDRYKTLAAAGRDIFSVARFVSAGQVYVNAASAPAADFLSGGMRTYDTKQALGWRISRIKVGTGGTSFQMRKGRQLLKLQSALLGRHQVGPLAFTAAFALELGLTPQQVTAGIAATAPYEHRMRPYRLQGATIIDDTYNGNLEGVRAGTALLHELSAPRKWYVTPGLVEQGRDSSRIHREMGRLIAASKADTVVLMRNSVTDWIVDGLRDEGYQGDLRVEADPLHFYANLQYFVAAGDLVLMQNDWTDNYA